ncbi:hypothetical protein BC937DRAFT_94054 [Endogone sp. FLAS-F59071]|nr:hypothetical protein BC937DRAFT_94054 [Endogone sp. FLAS-F59071]|eukprot:RUS14284.1 hypothetical protein BC937DRAFT_94054 [Endogone sp. FLAS-F59071]
MRKTNQKQVRQWAVDANGISNQLGNRQPGPWLSSRGNSADGCISMLLIGFPSSPFYFHFIFSPFRLQGREVQKNKQNYFEVVKNSVSDAIENQECSSYER